MASPRALGGAAVASPPLPSFASRRRRAARRARVASASSSSSSSSSTLDVFVEIQMPDGSVPPRLTFALRPDLCPKSVENFATLLSGANAGVDPALTYRGCAFEPFGGKYSHVCKGRGKTIFGPGKFVEREAMSATRNGTPGAGGGTYYGERVDLDDDDDRVTVLAVPTSGPGFGGSRFAIMRRVRSMSHWSPYDRVGVVNADP